MSTAEDTRIELNCNVLSGDRLIVVRTFDPDDAGEPFGFRLERSGTLTGSTYLTPEDARRLFNWLGRELVR